MNNRPPNPCVQAPPVCALLSVIAQGLRNTIQQTVLSPGLAGPARVTGSPADPICSVSIFGHDQKQRVRIEADAITLPGNSVRVKLVCVTSPEERKDN